MWREIARILEDQIGQAINIIIEDLDGAWHEIYIEGLFRLLIDNRTNS